VLRTHSGEALYWGWYALLHDVVSYRLPRRDSHLHHWSASAARRSTRPKGAFSGFRATGHAILNGPHVAAAVLLQLFTYEPGWLAIPSLACSILHVFWGYGVGWDAAQTWGASRPPYKFIDVAPRPVAGEQEVDEIDSFLPSMEFAKTRHRREKHADLLVSLLMVLHALWLDCKKLMELTAFPHCSCLLSPSHKSRDEWLCQS